MSSVRGIALTKEETLLLVQLVASNKIVTNKATNATNNLLKEEAWAKIAKKFNASISSCPRTTAQLRLKWENLKKAARKRNNQFKADSSKPDNVSPDKTLDRVAAILDATCDDNCVESGEGDPGKSLKIKTYLKPVVISDGGYEDGVILDRVEVKSTRPSRKRIFGDSSKRHSDQSNGKACDRKRKVTEEMAAANILRNTATARYYEAKTKALEAKIDKINNKESEEIELKLKNFGERIEILESENKKLKLEVDKLKNIISLKKFINSELSY